MKNIIYALLLLVSSSSLAWAAAVKITFPDFATIPPRILEITTPALQNGIIKYQHIMSQMSQSSICVEQGDDMSSSAFFDSNPNSFVSRLVSAANLSGTNSLAYPATCRDAVTIAAIKTCSDNPNTCNSDSSIVSKLLYQYVAKSQFEKGLVSISPGKTQMEVLLNEGWVSSITPNQIGLPASNEYCRSITAHGDINTGIATIQCLLKGSIAIEGKSIFLKRIDVDGAYSFIWTCSSDLAAVDKLKYAGLCNG